jgi:hypothetical protein
MCHITRSIEGKTIELSPSQVVIKNLKDLKHFLATPIVVDVTSSPSLMTSLNALWFIS